MTRSRSTRPAMTTTSRLLFPAIRWDREARSYDQYRPTMERGLELGVGGYIIFGGPAEAVRDLTSELRAASPHPLLIGADLERGAGQQFPGATSLPPPAALAELDDLKLTRRAGELTAREALALGIDWVYAPVADLDLEPENPIVGSRAFGGDPVVASRHVVAWIEGCQGAGALTCAKHFPGHGRTTSDSHLQLPTVEVSASELETDLVPFRAAIEAGVDSLMSAHVAYPALDPSGRPATLSRPILTDLLRQRMGFNGLVVTDALIMEGVLKEGAGEAEAAVAAVAAGCDVLLYPGDLDAVAAALARAQGSAVAEDRVAEALDRIAAAAAATAGAVERAMASGGAGDGWGRAEDRAWAAELALRCVRPLRGRPSHPRSVELVTVDDDVGGPFPTGPRDAFPAALRAGGVAVREVDRPTGELPVVVALYADIKGFKGRPGLSETALAGLGEVVTSPRGATVVLFGPPRIASSVPGADLLGAWGGEPLMQEAAARWLATEEAQSSS
jgi:beta-glucosidase-like glycosyl hydrolase